MNIKIFNMIEKSKMLIRLRYFEQCSKSKIAKQKDGQRCLFLHIAEYKIFEVTENWNAG